MQLKIIKHVKRVRAKGHTYLYFMTGQVIDGKAVLKKLPPEDDISFWPTYAALMAARTKRAAIVADLTIPRLIDLYERSPQWRELKEGSRITYAKYHRQLERDFAKAPANAFEKSDVLSLIDSMADRPAAANMMLVVLRRLYKWGRDRTHVHVDPTAGIDPFDGGEYEPWPEPLLLAALASDDHRVQWPVALLYYTAQRIGDVCLMQWTNIVNGRIEMTQEKTDKDLSIPIHRELRAILDAIPKKGFTILLNAHGNKATPPAVRSHLKRFARARGYNVVPHGLRKNAVNSLLECGCSTGEVSSISGQSLAIVEHYAKRRNNVRMASGAILKWEGNR